MGSTDSEKAPIGALATIATVAIALGVVVVIAGALTSAKDISAGGVILIGPIPIVIGSGSLGELLAVLATLLTLVLLVVTLYWMLARRKP